MGQFSLVSAVLLTFAAVAVAVVVVASRLVPTGGEGAAAAGCVLRVHGDHHHPLHSHHHPRLVCRPHAPPSLVRPLRK